MLSYTAGQTAILTSDSLQIKWLFETSGLYLSLFDCSYDGQDYTAAVQASDFSNITLNRGKSEYGIQAPNSFSITIGNKGNTYDQDTFKTAGVYNSFTVKLVISDDSDEDIFGTWTFNIKQADDFNQRIKIACEDYLQKYIKKPWPTKPLISSLAPSTGDRTNGIDQTDNLCLPVCIGTAFIPIGSVWVEAATDRLYTLGSSSYSYTVQELRSPYQSSGFSSTYLPGDYTFTQSTRSLSGSNYRCIAFMIHNPSKDGSTFYNGLWAPSGTYLNPLCKFSSTETSGVTTFADAIEFILEDMGIPGTMIDASSFSSAESTHSSWGLTFDYGFFKQEEGSKVLSNILNACNSTLIMTDQIELHILDRTNRTTITEADVKKGTFKPGSTIDSENDSLYVEYPYPNGPQDNFITSTVSSTNGGNQDETASDTLTIPYYTNNVYAQRAAQLYCQRKIWPEQKYSFSGSRRLLFLQPGDTITINSTKYGGTFTAIIDSMKLDKTGAPSFTIVKYKYDLEDWTDSTPASIPLETDDNIYDMTDPMSINGFFQIGEPTQAESSYGDIWIDIDKEDPVDSTCIYRYEDLNGTNVGILGWRSAADSAIGLSYLKAYLAEAAADTALAIADGEIVGYFQTSEPGSGMSFGDIWIDTTGGAPLDGTDVFRYDDAAGGSTGALSWHNRQYNAVGLSYVEAYNAEDIASTAQIDADSAQATADNKVNSWAQDGYPTASEVGEGDIWIETDNNNTPYRAYQDGVSWKGATGWVEIQDGTISIAQAAAEAAHDEADLKVVTYYQDSTPTASDEGDFWVETDNGNKLYRAHDAGVNWKGSTGWVVFQYSAISDGAIKLFVQDGTPSGASFGDIWVDTNRESTINYDCILRYEDSNGYNFGTLSWHLTPEVNGANNAIGRAYVDQHYKDNTEDEINDGIEIDESTGGITMKSAGAIKSEGRTRVVSSTDGFFLGYDTNESEYGFGVGDGTDYIRYIAGSGENLDISMGTGGVFNLYGGLTIHDGAGATIADGGNLTMQSTTGTGFGDRAIIIFDNPTTDFYFAGGTNVLSLYPASANAGYLYMGRNYGGTYSRFLGVGIYAENSAHLHVTDSGGVNTGKISLSASAAIMEAASSAGTGQIYLTPNYIQVNKPFNLDIDPYTGNARYLGNSTQYWYMMYIRYIRLQNSGNIRHASDNDVGNVGGSSQAFLSMYSVNYYNKSVFLDDKDDLEIIKNMKGNGEVNDQGLEYLDIQTCPDWMTNKDVMWDELNSYAQEDGEIVPITKEELAEQLKDNTSKYGQHLHASVGKKADLALGGIRKLLIKFEELEQRINGNETRTGQ